MSIVKRKEEDLHYLKRGTRVLVKLPSGSKHGVVTYSGVKPTVLLDNCKQVTLDAHRFSLSSKKLPDDTNKEWWGYFKGKGS